LPVQIDTFIITVHGSKTFPTAIAVSVVLAQSSSLHCYFHTVVSLVVRNADSARESGNLLSGPLYNDVEAGLNRLLKKLGNDPYEHGVSVPFYTEVLQLNGLLRVI
jgi:hypothetical protein